MIYFLGGLDVDDLGGDNIDDLGGDNTDDLGGDNTDDLGGDNKLIGGWKGFNLGRDNVFACEKEDDVV